MKGISVHFQSRHKPSTAQTLLLLLMLGMSAPATALAACDTRGSAASTCTEQGSNIHQEFLQQRLDRAITSVPEIGQASARLEGRTRNPANGAAPVLVTPEGDEATIRTSIGQWSSYLSQQDAEKIEGMKALAPKDFKFPELAPIPSSKVDVWGNTKTEGLSGGTGLSGYASHFGADYAVNPDFLFGAMVEFEDTRQAATTAGGAAYLVGPYIAMQLNGNLKLDARAGWGQGSDTISADGIANNIATERSLAKASINGNWNLQNWQFTPSAELTFATEASSGIVGSKVEKSSLSVSPEVRHPVQLESGQLVEHFINYNSTLDLDLNAFDGLPEGAGAYLEGTLEGGVSVTKPGEYTVRATVESAEARINADTKSRLKLTIPLN